MRLHHPHAWEVTPKEAIAIQERLRHLVRLEDCMGEVRRVAGTDVGFERGTAVT
ncbi:MAG TPA: endonuclease V, partial [Gammaproteobacteria bacterium]|nr:endonuclease V [Gammaproteobacteria bacterium]